MVKGTLIKYKQDLKQLVLAEDKVLSDSLQRICAAQNIDNQEHTVSMRGRGSWADMQRIRTAESNIKYGEGGQGSAAHPLETFEKRAPNCSWADFIETVMSLSLERMKTRITHVCNSLFSSAFWRTCFAKKVASGLFALRLLPLPVLHALASSDRDPPAPSFLQAE